MKAMMKKNSMAFEEKQTNKQTAPLVATKYEKRNDQCFIVFSKKVVFLASKIGFNLYTRLTCTRVYTVVLGSGKQFKSF